MKMTNSRLSSPLAPLVCIAYVHARIASYYLRLAQSLTPLCRYLSSHLYVSPRRSAALMFMFLYFRSSAVICVHMGNVMALHGRGGDNDRQTTHNQGIMQDPVRHARSPVLYPRSHVIQVAGLSRTRRLVNTESKMSVIRCWALPNSALGQHRKRDD
jgi:hypothetical protein